MKVSQQNSLPIYASEFSVEKLALFLIKPERKSLCSFFIKLIFTSSLFLALGFYEVYAQITVVNSQTNTSTSASITISKPTGLVVGDVMIANITQRNSEIDAVSTGWTKHISYKVGTANRWATILYKVATATDVSSTNFTFDVAGASSIAGGITAFRGVNTSINGGIEVTGASAADDSAGPIVPSQITTLSNNSMVLFYAQISGAGISFTSGNWTVGANAMTQAYTVHHETKEPSAGLAYFTRTTAGATGQGSKAISGSGRWGGVLLALKPQCNSTSITSSSLAGQTRCSGESFSPISVTASGVGTLNYQWYRNSSASTTGGTLIVGATSSSYTPLSSTPGTTYYYVVVSGSCVPVTSSISGAFIVNGNSFGTIVNGNICVNQTLPAGVTQSTSGATGINAAAATGLPPGISVSWASNQITFSGTPTNSGTYNYSIPLTGGCGASIATGTISVGLSPTASVSTFSQNVCLNRAIIPITHTLSRVNSMGTPSNLPPGVIASVSGNTLTLSGTPTMAGTFNYSIPLSNCTGTTNATGTIVVSSNCVSPCSTLIEDANNIIIQFTGNCEWTVPEGIDDFEILVIGGGGGGGARSGGGGGAGGLIHLKAAVNKVNSPGIKVGDKFTITVGAKGAGAPNKNTRGGAGGTSTLTYANSTISAGGGGGGGSNKDSDGAAGDGVDNVVPQTLPNGLSIAQINGGSGGGVGHKNDSNKQGRGRGLGKNGGNGDEHAGGGGGSARQDGSSAQALDAGGIGALGIRIEKFGSRFYAGGGGGGSRRNAPINLRISELSGGTGGYGDGGSATNGLDGETPGSGGGGSGHDDDVTGGDGAAGAVIISYPIYRLLPIEFIHFTASFDASGREGDLSWATAKEWGNSHFEVQRSVNDVQNWKTIGEVEGAGYSNNRNDYAYIDKALPAAGGNIFYRLKQIDFEGDSSFSVTRAIRVEAVAGASSWIIYPNPTSGENFRIELANSETPDEGGVTAVLSNTLGQTEHFNDYNLDQLSQKLGSALINKASGIYILTLTWSGKTESYRIIKN